MSPSIYKAYLLIVIRLITVYNIMNPIVIPENNVTCYYRK